MKYLTLPFFVIFSLSLKAELVDYSEDAPEGKKNIIFKVPKRQVSIIASEEGFYPKSIAVFEGESVRFFVTSTTEQPACFMVNEKELFLSAKKGRITEGEVFFAHAGEFEYHCPSTKHRGRITVIGKKKIERKIASEPARPKVWMPKDDR